MFQVKAELADHKKVKGNYFHLVLRAPKIAKASLPGQFVNIRVTDGLQPLLRRPFSIYRSVNNNIEVLYEVVGKGTEILSQRKPGEYLDMIGPLGNGFDLRQAVGNKRQAVLVGGGIGIAPLIFLAEKLTECKIKNAKCKNIVLIGTKTKSQILCEKEFKRLGCDVKISTDDGSLGFSGRVTDLLKHLLPITDYRLPITIYACGPHPMLKEVSRLSKKYNLPAQVSLDEHMACGIGACLGCVVKTKEGYKRACKEGPVFSADEIIW